MSDIQGKLLDELLEADYTAEEAVALITSLGELPEGAMTVSEASTAEFDIRKYINVKDLPKNFFKWSKQEQCNQLWQIGFNTKKFVHQVVVGWFRDPPNNPMPVYGCFLIGSERVDKAYTNMVIEGCNVASEESRYFYLQEELREIRGARGKPKKTKA
jgi:hypothetical protein